MKTFTDILKNYTRECYQLSAEKSALVIQNWYEHFSWFVKKQYGRYDFFQCDWEVFSSGIYPSIAGEAAVREFEITRCNSFYYMLGDEKEQVYYCQTINGQLPPIGPIRSDITFSDSELKWTMCYTLENDLGPFYAK
jgi:hypothetical protein